jgi:hypothetical protein
MRRRHFFKPLGLGTVAIEALRFGAGPWTSPAIQAETNPDESARIPLDFTLNATPAVSVSLGG